MNERQEVVAVARAPGSGELVGLITATHAAAAQIYRTWVEQGQVRDMAWPVASALIVGPAYDYLRKCQDMPEHDEAIELLVQSAWMSVCLA